MQTFFQRLMIMSAVSIGQTSSFENLYVKELLMFVNSYLLKHHRYIYLATHNLNPVFGLLNRWWQRTPRTRQRPFGSVRPTCFHFSIGHQQRSSFFYVRQNDAHISCFASFSNVHFIKNEQTKKKRRNKSASCIARCTHALHWPHNATSRGCMLHFTNSKEAPLKRWRSFLFANDQHHHNIFFYFDQSHVEHKIIML